MRSYGSTSAVLASFLKAAVWTPLPGCRSSSSSGGMTYVEDTVAQPAQGLIVIEVDRVGRATPRAEPFVCVTVVIGPVRCGRTAVERAEIVRRRSSSCLEPSVNGLVTGGCGHDPALLEGAQPVVLRRRDAEVGTRRARSAEAAIGAWATGTPLGSTSVRGSRRMVCHQSALLNRVRRRGRVLIHPAPLIVDRRANV